MGMSEPPHTESQEELARANERSAYHALLEVLVDAQARRETRTLYRPEARAPDGTVSSWRFLGSDQFCSEHCPRCEARVWVYVCERTYSFAHYCWACRAIDVFDRFGRRIALVTGSAAVTESPTDSPQDSNNDATAQPTCSGGKVLPFVALWRPGQRPRCLTDPSQPASREPKD
jgi:hypothetical protein